MISSLEPGSNLGRYQLLCVVAQGGMGSVWAARLRADHGFQRNVAVKTILPQYAEETRFREMFLDEARLASRIVHPNVVQVLDLAEQDGVLFQAMEWVDGDSLRTLSRLLEAKNEQIAWPIAIRILLDVCKGLHAAHELRDEEGTPLQVVHRDVSPQNIMLSLDGAVRISDFGIAKARDRLSAETTEGHVKGKLRYMAPEQALGKALDRRADIWSLGAILYELLSGRPLFDAPNDVALLHEVVSSPPTLIFEQSVHPRMLALLRRALSRSPDGRQATAEDFAADLRRAAKESDLEANMPDLVSFFQEALGQRCEVRHEIISEAAKTASTLNSAEIQVVGQSSSDDHHRGTLSRFVRTVETGRRRSLIAGSLLLGGFVLVGGWYVVKPPERLIAERAVLLEPSHPMSAEPAAPVAPASNAPANSTAEKVPMPPTSSGASGTPRPTTHPPPPASRPPFEDIDDGF